MLLEKNHNVLPTGTPKESVFRDKADLLDYCYDVIEEAFNDLGAYAPDIATLMHSPDRFVYARAHSKKDRSKIGYRISFQQNGKHPSFVLVINSFKHGGEKRVLKSFDITAPLFDALKSSSRTALLKGKYKPKRNVYPDINKPAHVSRSVDEDNQHRAIVFSQLSDRYDHASVDVKHPYLNKKGISHTEHLRVCGNDILIPLWQIKAPGSRDKDKQAIFEKVGFQVIDANGNKKVHIKAAGLLKSAFMIVSGNLTKARDVFLCEGYATGDKVPFLSKRPGVCVISCVSANNILPVIVKANKLFVRRGNDKRFFIVADNDVESAKEGKGNAGLRCAFDALRIAGKGASIIIPECLEYQSDWDDLYHVNSKAAKDAFKGQSFKPYEIGLEHLKHFANSNRPSASVKRVIFNTAREMIKLCPALFSFEGIVDRIFTVCSHTGVSKASIEITCNKLYKQHEIEANKARVLTDRFVDRFIEVDNIESASDAILSVQQDDALLDKNIVFLIDAPMGSGKTQKILKPQFQMAEQAGYFPVCTYSTCSLTMAGSSLLGASHYDRDKTHDFSLSSIYGGKRVAATSLAVTCNSLTSDRFLSFVSHTSSFFIDEASQVYRSIVSGTVDDDKRVETERLIAKKINQSKYTFLADADMNDLIAKYIASIKEENVVTVAISVSQKPFVDTCYEYIATTDTNYNHAYVLDRLLADIENNNIYCALDSCAKANIVFEALTQKILVDDILLITRDTVATDKVRAFLQNPNDYVRQFAPRIIIATPAIQSGVSIEVDHFNLGYGFYTGTVTPNDFRQMLHRVRSLKQFKIALSSPSVRHDPFREDPEYILLQAVKREIEYYQSSIKVKESAKIGVDQYDIVFKDGSKHYEFLAADLMASNAKERNNATNYFLMQAHSLGVDITPFSIENPDDKSVIKAQMKGIKESVKNKDVLAVTGVNTLTQIERDEMDALERPSKIEQNQMRRFDIAKLTGRELVTQEDVEFVDKHPINKLRNYNLCEDFLLAQEMDALERKNGVAVVQRSNKESMALLYCYMVSLLLLDENTLEGVYGEREAQALKEAILASDELLAFVRLKLAIPLNDTYQPRRLANNLFKSLFGLKAYAKSRSRKDDRKQTYALDQDEVDLFMKLARCQKSIDAVKKANKPIQAAA